MEAMEEDIIELLRLPTPAHPAFTPGYIEMLVAPLQEALFPVASPRRSFSEMALNHPRSPNIQSLDDQQLEAIEGMENTVTIPPKKRKRRVFGPVAGNNDVGKKGKLRCEHCRKRRWKCIFNDPLDACEFCEERKLECVKTMGPKAAASTNALVSVGSSSVSRLSLITDCNLDEMENFYLRWAHMQWAWSDGPRSVSLQYIWQTYGSTFEDKSLHYAILCTASRAFHEQKTPSEPQLPYFQFYHRFLVDLRQSLLRSNVSEVHLLALFLILNDETDDVAWADHFRGFLSILESLVRRAKTGDVVCRLPFLHYYLLNCLVYRNWEERKLVFGHHATLAFDAWTLLDRLEVPQRLFDTRLARFLPGKFFLDSSNRPTLQQYLDQEWDKQLNPVWPLMDLKPILRCEFLGYVDPLPTDSYPKNIDYLLYAEHRFTELLEIPIFRDTLEYVKLISDNFGGQVIDNPHFDRILAEFLDVWSSMTILFQLRGEHRKIVFSNPFRIVRAAISLTLRVWHTLLVPFAVLLRPASLEIWEDLNALRGDWADAVADFNKAWTENKFLPYYRHDKREVIDGLWAGEMDIIEYLKGHAWLGP